jgi:hypothetical protein
LKYLIIAALVGFVFVVVYARLRPYLQLIRKVVNSLNVSAGVASPTASPQQRSGGEHKLVRCAGCGTWIPANRTFNLNSGLATYCSRECLEKKAAPKERKLAG